MGFVHEQGHDAWAADINEVLKNREIYKDSRYYFYLY